MKVTRQCSLFAGVVALCLFIVLFLFGNVALATDSELALLMNADRGTVFTTIMVVASRFGREYFWIGILGLMLVFRGRETKLMALELALLFGVGIVAGEMMKYLVYKPRPFTVMIEIVTRVPRDYDSSFPSGHALIVSIGAVFSLLRFKKKTIALLLTVEAAVVAYSRVYVGMHFPLDVLASISLGSSIVLLEGHAFDRWLRPRIVRALTVHTKLSSLSQLSGGTRIHARGSEGTSGISRYISVTALTATEKIFSDSL